MLNMLRGAVSGWTAKILLAILVVSFAVWGIGDVFRGAAPSTVLTAGKTKVSLQDYALTYQRIESQFARQLGRPLTSDEAQMFGVDQTVIGRLMGEAVLDEQGRRIGLGLSQNQLAETIAQDPAFRNSSGNFSRAAFRNALANARIREDDYIRSQEDAAVRSQLVDAVSNSAAVPSTFATALGLYNGERRTVDYIVLTASSIPPVADPSDKELKAYYDDHKGDYAAPEYRAISYAVLTPEALADPSAITDEQVKKDYEAHKANYTTAAQRHVRQIVFSDADVAKVAEAKLKSGASFEEVAKDAGRSTQDTDLGFLTKAEIPDPKVADAAFSLSEGATSGIVQGTFGPVILKVTEIKPETVKPLSEVSSQIRHELALNAAADVVSSAYNSFEDARAGGATYEEAAKTAGIRIKKVAAVDAEGNGPDGKPVDLPAQKDLLSGAFQAEPGFDNFPINYQSNGYVFYDVDGVDPAHDRKLDEVHDKVVADWKKAETQKKLEQRVGELKKEVASGQTIAQVAQTIGVQVQTAQSITRQSGVSELGRDGVKVAFSGVNGTVATASGQAPGSQLLLKVREVAPPADPAQNVAANERQQLSTMLQNDLLDSYVTLLQNDIAIQVNPAGIEKAKAMVR